MKKSLTELAEKIYSPLPEDGVTGKEYQDFCNNCIVALMAGGESSRFKSILGSRNIHKNSHELPNGDTMIEMTIRMYRDAGVKNFVALVFHHADSIIERLGDGSNLGVNICYSHDPEKPVGKGGAVRNALDNGSIPRDKYLIVHNPDDVILDYEGSFPEDIARGHLTAAKKGAVGTVVMVKKTPYSYTAMKVEQGFISDIEMYPMIPLPTHIGVTIFSPKAYPQFEELFDLTKKSDFEQAIFPILAEKKELAAIDIPSQCWLAVNTPKSYSNLLKRLDIENE